MSETSASKFCVNCGQPLRVDAKFCVNCGTPRPAVAAPPPDVGSLEPDAPEVSGGVVAPAAGRTVAAVPTEPVAPPVAPKPALLNRTQRIVLAAGIGIVIVVAVAIILLKRNDNHTSVASANNPPATSVAVLPSVAPDTEAPAPTTNAALRSVVSRLDAELTDSAAQVAQLQSIIARFAPSGNGACGLSAAQAATQTGAIIDNRRAEVAALQTLATTDDATARQLVTLLQTAIGLSLQSDSDYQGWIAGNTSTDASVPCRRNPDQNFQAVQQIERQVGDAKTAFATAYDPVATRLGGVRADRTNKNF